MPIPDSLAVTQPPKAGPNSAFASLCVGVAQLPGGLLVSRLCKNEGCTAVMHLVYSSPTAATIVPNGAPRHPLSKC